MGETENSEKLKGSPIYWTVKEIVFLVDGEKEIIECTYIRKMTLFQ